MKRKSRSRRASSSTFFRPKRQTASARFLAILVPALTVARFPPASVVLRLSSSRRSAPSSREKSEVVGIFPRRFGHSQRFAKQQRLTTVGEPCLEHSLTVASS